MDLLFILAGVLIVIALYIGISYFQKRYDKRMQPHPSLDTKNLTNYNIAASESGKYENLSPAEAKAILDKWEASDYIPTLREFYAIQRVVERA